MEEDADSEAPIIVTKLPGLFSPGTEAFNQSINTVVSNDKRFNA